MFVSIFIFSSSFIFSKIITSLQETSWHPHHWSYRCRSLCFKSITDIFFSLIFWFESICDWFIEMCFEIIYLCSLLIPFESLDLAYGGSFNVYLVICMSQKVQGSVFLFYSCMPLLGGLSFSWEVRRQWWGFFNRGRASFNHGVDMQSLGIEERSKGLKDRRRECFSHLTWKFVFQLQPLIQSKSQQLISHV